MSPALSWSAQRRWGAAVLVGGVLALGGLVAWATADGLVYYRTPTEVVRAGDAPEPVRVAGLVVDGSLVRSEGASQFVLTDGATQLRVRYDGLLPALVQEGEGAVVEGRLGPDGAVAATEVLLRHSNEYGPAEVTGP
ncbi:cytochrome c maturation protein CcmE [Microbacterium album]|uniref:Cytochrome c maturation protein CcmE n=1 Tax=Microbacterium album TaxID=2053191 RepID=A0A917MMC8_9MICO|nr:cytochrome c maturation protein CcmE [Microbacterium album]GGH47998.1 hypothetical protein GCM10010921_25140 [Microbacterium album]